MNRYFIFAIALASTPLLADSRHDNEDRDRCHEKVDVCHKGRHTINIDTHAVQAHLNHGDTLGACEPTPPECELDEDCMDNVFCNGAEQCVDSVCVPASEGPCHEDTVCIELEGCVEPPECQLDSDCSNSLFCDGQEVCILGNCHLGSEPCLVGQTCDELSDVCLIPPECTEDEDCSDSLFCTGHETCVNGTCSQSIARCALGEVCDEEQDGCTSPSEGEGEGETPPSEGEGEGEPEPPTGEGEGEGEPTPGEPRKTPVPQGSISGSSVFACSQSNSTGFLMFALLLPLFFRVRKYAVLVLLITAGSVNAEALTSTSGLFSSQDTTNVLGADTIPENTFQLNSSFDYAHAPVTFRDENFKLLSNAVDNQFTLRLAGAAALTDSLQFEMGLPVSVAAGQGVEKDGKNAIGFADARAGLRYALNKRSDSAQLALTLHSTLPLSYLSINGQPEIGEGLPTLTPGVALRLGDKDITGLLNVGFTARVPKQIADFRLGSSLDVAGAIQTEFVDNRLVGFIDGRTQISGTPFGSSRTFIPMEVGIGLKAQEQGFYALASVGAGLLPDVGVPLIRTDIAVGVSFDFNQASVVTKSEPSVANMPEATPAAPVVVEKPAATSGNGLVFIKDDRLVLLQPVYFYFDSDQIRPESIGILKEVAVTLQSHPEIKTVIVEGHTSSEGTAEYNLVLSARRSVAVVRQLRELGVKDTTLKSIGLGEQQPITTNKTKLGRDTNRRVEFKIKD